jgi:hypothetical protein
VDTRVRVDVHVGGVCAAGKKNVHVKYFIFQMSVQLYVWRLVEIGDDITTVAQCVTKWEQEKIMWMMEPMSNDR